MQTLQQKPPLRLRVRDASKQKEVTVDDIPRDATVGEVVQQLLSELGYAVKDESGAPLSYQALLERERRHVHDTERIGDAFVQDDSLTVHPNIQAGCVARP